MLDDIVVLTKLYNDLYTLIRNVFQNDMENNQTREYELDSYMSAAIQLRMRIIEFEMRKNSVGNQQQQQELGLQQQFTKFNLGGPGTNMPYPPTERKIVVPQPDFGIDFEA